MAITIGTSYEPEFTQYLSEPATSEDQARLDAYMTWRDQIRRKAAIERRYPEMFPVPDDLLPKAVRLTKGDKIWDYSGYIVGGGAVSAAFREAVESIEPGVHQFLPVEVLYQDGTPYGEPFWYFVVCTQIDAISAELGGVRRDLIAGWKISTTILPGGRSKLAVHKDRIAGRAAWRDCTFSGETFLADALRARLEADGLVGWCVTNEWKEI